MLTRGFSPCLLPIAYDLTRLCYAPPTPTPRGIDRVELALADYFFRSWPGDCVAILPTPWGIRSLDRRYGLKVLQLVRSTWRENIAAADDPAYVFVREALKGTGAAGRYSASQGKAPPRWRAVSARILRLIKEVGVPLGASAANSAPKDAVYLNIGHVGLAVDMLLQWLQRRPDIKPVFMLHDTIPLDYPEFASAASRGFHSRMVSNTARHAAGLIVTTESAKRTIISALGESAPPNERIFASPLPVSDLFVAPVEAAGAGSASYFVFCGSIEPRKNLILLLMAWREIIARLGTGAPKLLVIGARTSDICETAAMLDRCATIKSHVIEVEGLSSNGLRRLLAGAKALLMPSFAEGFGIPIIEALACGAPVIASDIAAHREAGGTAVTYLDPNDGPGWVRAILSHNANPTKVEVESSICTWPSYCAALTDFIAAIE